MENPFLSIEYRLFNIKELNDAEIIMLSFILSHQKQNKDFYYTNKQLVSSFKERYNVKYIEKILKNLSALNLIQRITTKEYYSENNKWGNRRIIIVNIENLEYLINNPVELLETKDIPNNPVGLLETKVIENKINGIEMKFDIFGGLDFSVEDLLNEEIIN